MYTFNIALTGHSHKKGTAPKEVSDSPLCGMEATRLEVSGGLFF